MTHEHRRSLLLAGLAFTCATRAHAQCEVWSSVGDGVPRVEVVASFDDGSGPALFVGGPMPSPGWISRWDGSAWTDLGDLSGGLGIVVKALTVFDDGTGPALYVGGNFLLSPGESSSTTSQDGMGRRGHRSVPV